MGLTVPLPPLPNPVFSPFLSHVLIPSNCLSLRFQGTQPMEHDSLFWTQATMQQALGPDLATVSSFPESLQEARDVYRPQCWSSGDQGNANVWSKLRMVMACPGNGHPMPDPPAAHCGSVEPSLPPHFLPSSTPSSTPSPASFIPFFLSQPEVMPT